MPIRLVHLEGTELRPTEQSTSLYWGEGWTVGSAETSISALCKRGPDCPYEVAIACASVVPRLPSGKMRKEQQ